MAVEAVVIAHLIRAFLPPPLVTSSYIVYALSVDDGDRCRLVEAIGCNSAMASEKRCPGRFHRAGTLANSSFNPSDIVGCVRIASRKTV